MPERPFWETRRSVGRPRTERPSMAALMDDFGPEGDILSLFLLRLGAYIDEVIYLQRLHVVLYGEVHGPGFKEPVKLQGLSPILRGYDVV